MENVLDFIVEHWAAVSAVVLWIAARLIKSEKNYDIVEMIVKFIGNNIIPNRRKDKIDPVNNGDYKPGKNNAPNNILKLVVLFVLFGGLLNVLLPVSSLAQLNGNFKTLRLVNVITPTDTANVLPINATIYYNEVTNKLMAYEDGQWKELIRSGGGITTASNGLNVVGSDVRLGGALTNATSIDLNGNNFTLSNGGTAGTIDFVGRTVTMRSDIGGNISLNSGGGVITLNSGETFAFASDYSASYTARSIVDKAYVDSRAGAVGANNEVQTSDGSGGFVASNMFFDETSGLMTLGTSSLAGNRQINAVNSTTNATLNLSSQSLIDIYPSGSFGGSAVMSISGSGITGNGTGALFQILSLDPLNVRGSTTTLKTTDAGSGSTGNLTISTGNATGGSGDSGDIIIEPGTSAGGSKGLILLTNLPTSDPGVSGALWNDAGTLKISP